MHISEKIKLFLSKYAEELGVSAVIILVAFSSFYLGVASQNGASGSQEPISIVNKEMPAATSTISSAQAPISVPKVASQAKAAAPNPAAAIAPAAPQTGPIIASKNGKKYYFSWCSGISRISDPNKIYFASAAEAEKFGLSLAANCTASK
jgi:hypothetical protein